MKAPRASLILLSALLCLVTCARAFGASEALEAARRASDSVNDGAAGLEERREALAKLEEAARLFLGAGEPHEAARALNRAGRLRLTLNAPQEALDSHRRALSLLRPKPAPDIKVDALNGLGAAYAFLRDEARAEDALRRALALGERAGLARGRAQALLTLSAVQNYSNHIVALETARASLALWQATDDRAGLARAFAQVGLCHMALSALPEATYHYEQALQLWGELNNPSEQAGVLINLGFIEYRKGEWQNEILLMTRAQGLIDEQAEPEKMGQVAAGLAEAFRESGMPEAAIPHNERALDFYRRTQDSHLIWCATWELGRTYYAKGDYPEALTRLRQSLEGVGKDGLEAAQTYEHLGRTLIATGEYDEALRHLRAALDIYTRVVNPKEAAQARALIGQVYQRQGKAEGARKHYREALAAFRALSDRVNEAATLYASGTLEMERGDLGAAEELLRRSIELTENMRRDSASADLTAAFSATVHERYEQYAECLMRKHRSDPTRGFDVRAFESIEAARGRSLAELLRATRTSLVPGLDPRLAERERSLRQALRVKEGARVALLARDYKREDLAALDAELARLAAEYKLAEADIRARHPAYGQLAGPAGWTLRRIQQEVVADDETVLLEYSLGAERGHVWAVTRDRLTSYELPPRALVERAAERVYQLLASHPGADGGEARAGAEQELDAAARELGRLILSPAAAALEGRARVVVVTDGALDYVPFQLLPEPSGGEPLVAAREVVYAPSASVLGQLREEAARRPAHARTLAAFGDPVFAADYAQRRGGAGGDEIAALSKAGGEGWRSQLRGIEVEGDSLDSARIRGLRFAAQELANLYEVARGGEPVVAAGFDATRERLQTTDLSQFAILHFATHGLLDPQRPDSTGLLLSTVDPEGRARGGFVGLRDIYGLRAPVGLVVLSACRTALGKEVRGEGMVGLTRGFLYAGASGVVSSLWKVDDEATSELMKRFYKNMLDGGMTPAAALRAAQNSVRREPQWRSPYYWAAFTLQGEHRQVLRPARATAASFYQKAAAVSGVLLLLAAFGTFAAWRLRRRASAGDARSSS